jgi:hypothetical protein
VECVSQTEVLPAGRFDDDRAGVVSVPATPEGVNQ